MTTGATALDEKVRRLETDVRELEQRVEDAHQRAEDAKRVALAARQDQERIAADLRKTTTKAEAVDKALKDRMQEEATRAREVGAVWRMVQIVASLGLFAWSLWTGKLTATLEYLRQLASGQGK